MGYARAGFEVTGVDVVVRKNNPHPVIERDCLDLDPAWIAANFDAVHASPPCQGYTDLRHAPGARGAPRLIAPVRDMLEASGLPYVIENVEGARAEMHAPITLCGTMFGLGAYGCELQRHRLFESNVEIAPPGPCAHSGGAVIGVYGGHARNRSAKKGGRGTKDEWPAGHRDAMGRAMGIDWMTCGEMSEAIPPAYTEHLGRQLLAHLSRREAA